MAFNLTNLNYTDGVAGEYILKTIGKAATLENVRVLPRIKNNLVLQAINAGSNLVADYTPDFSNATGDIEIKGVTISMIPKKVNNFIDRDTLEQLWDAAQYQAGALNTAPLPSMIEFIGSTMESKIALEVEDEVWNSTGGTKVVGYFKQAADDATVIDVTATTVTASNILDEIQKVYDALPISVRQTGEARIYLSTRNMALYRKAVGLLGIYNGSLDTTNVSTLYFDNTVRLVAINSIPNNKMLGTHLGNIVFGTDLTDDFNKVAVIEKLLSGGNYDGYQFLMKFKYDVKLIWGGDVVLYS